MTDIVERLTAAIDKEPEVHSFEAMRDAKADIERLRADKVILQDALNVRTDLAIQQDGKIEQLRSLLRPFAEAAVAFEPWDGFDTAPLTIEHGENGCGDITLGDLLRASAALKDTTP